MPDKADKILEKLKNSPHNATFSDIRTMLEEEGFLLDRIAGSHHVFRKGSTIFAIPVHHNRVKSVYVKRAIAIIEDSKGTV
ncbi:MAG TPA: type II toxin-antitoxin system HicA family toxin [Candidatus Kapabacteria bacterium]|jgi:predicted RNA binding protein YcfA (HicA-like mRNA interferase family)